MRTVDSHLLDDKMDEVVTHYINSHPHGEPVHVDTNSLGLNIQEEGTHRVVTLMHPQNFSSQMCRQVSVSEHVNDGHWGEELLDPEVRIAALAAHLAQHSRVLHHQMVSHHKVVPVRGEVDSVMLDRLAFNGQPLDQNESIVVEVPSLPPLPQMQGKRCPDTDWFSKTKTSLKDDAQILSETDMCAGASPAAKQSKKSLPHKKRISRKLKRNNGNSTPQQDIVVITCNDAQEEILPDSFVTGVQHQEHLTEETHHIGNEVRPVYICQICAAFYGEDQLKFYQHLKQHYEPHATIIIENPVPDLGIDKMTNTCIVDNVATLPDSIVELSLESTMPKTTIYQHQGVEKHHIMYTTSDKSLNYNNRYPMSNMEKEVHTAIDKHDLYDTLETVELYSCNRCNKTFRKQKQCEAHIKEVHSKLEELNEFSEPEDLMEGIHVSVEDAECAPPPLPHLHHPVYAPRLTNGNSQTMNCSDDACPIYHSTRETQEHGSQLKEEVFHRMFEGEMDHQTFGGGIIQEGAEIAPEPEEAPVVLEEQEKNEEETRVPEGPPPKKGLKTFACLHCPRIFHHRNSLLYHTLSHKGKKPHQCPHCGNRFYTKGALKVHVRVHNGDKPYKCDECGRDFRQWGDLKYHVTSLHTETKHYKCEFCEKEFSRKYSLSVHRRIHTGEKNYKCEYCVKSFRTSSYRLTHMRTHTGYKPHKCPECEKCFRVQADLRRHLLIHEKAKKRLEESQNKTKEKKEKDSKKSVLKSHIKIESKECKGDESDSKKPKTPPKNDKEKKTKPKRSKKGAPNVTVTSRTEHRMTEMQDYPSNVDVYDGRTYAKFKEVYTDPSVDNQLSKLKDVNYDTNHKVIESRDFATLKPLYRTPNDEKTVLVNRDSNTDGKMVVFTHVEKNDRTVVGSSQININDIRPNLELRESRTDLNGDLIENGFFERFNESAFYNIPTV